MIAGYLVCVVLIMLFVFLGAIANMPAIAFIGFLFYFVMLAYGLALFVGSDHRHDQRIPGKDIQAAGHRQHGRQVVELTEDPFENLIYIA